MSFDSNSRLVCATGDAQSDQDGYFDWGFGIARSRQRRLGISDTSFSHFFDSDTSEGGIDSDTGSMEAEEFEGFTAESSREMDDDVPFNFRRRHLRRGARKKKRKIRESSEESFPSDTDKRTSSRLRNTKRRNLRERLEDDDMSEVEVEAPKPRFFGAKEQFLELPSDDDFRAFHTETCFSCGHWEDDDPEQGPLVFCQGCTSSYHQGCLGSRSSRRHLVTKVDEGNFILQCANCLGTKHQDHDIVPHLGHCATCKEAGPMSEPLRRSYTPQEEQRLREQNGGIDPVTYVEASRVNNLDNVLVRCTGCKRGFHHGHLLSSPEEDRSDIRVESWQCHDCCDAPAENPPIEVIVAWRPKIPAVQDVPRLVEMIPEIKKEYLVKWTKKSYFRVTWMPGDWVWCIAHPAMFKSFFRSTRSSKPIMTTEEAVPEENLLVDIIFDVEYIRKPKSAEERADPDLVKRAYVKFQGLPYEDIVWEDPPSKTEVEQWEAFKTALVDRSHGETIRPPESKALQNRLKEARAKRFDQSLILKSQPTLVSGGNLMEYQMDGVNWLYYMFLKKRNAILADDMGLGKTVQVITLFSALIENLECFPFLVVVPNSTVPNWRREIKHWAPKVRVITYYGSAWARGMTEEREMFHNGRLCCHVVVASYESMNDQRTKRVLGGISWAGLVVDEGQRLKNDDTALYDRLRRMKFGFKLLLTGTPLQNNIRELFNLVQFLDPTKNAEKLEEQYGGPLTSDDIRELHEMIRPCFLRRTKAEVLPFLPPMVQIIIPVSMSVVQKKLYKSILEKSPTLIKAIVRKQVGPLKRNDRHNLNNIMMQLRKCLCHPFIYNRDIEEQTLDPELSHQRLVEASCKLQLLGLMLPRLRERGHRVLIFSQFLQNLDIVEDFLSGLDMQYSRLDGQLSSREKQKQIDQFNAPDSKIFAFLLSTRSGGVGINLATADTVIIMDPDFNPKQDMQALSRAHRIGQKNTVMVFHLVVRASVEEKIMQKGKTKMALDHVLIDRMEADENEEDLESILKHGAQALFDDDDSGDLKYDIHSIDRLLDRSQAEQAKENTQEDDSNTGNQGQFNFARVWQIDRGRLEEVIETEDSPMDTSAWEKILSQRERETQEELSRQAEGLGRGKRKRAAISYNTKEGAEDDETTWSPVKMRKTAVDKDYQQPDDDVGEESESDKDADAMQIANDASTINEASQQGKIKILFISNALVQYGLSYACNCSRHEIRGHPPLIHENILVARSFQHLPPPAPVLPHGADGANDSVPPCVACHESHVPGKCPLRLAGVELCGLCGMAHYGVRQVCPHLKSTLHIQRMLEALENSPEDARLVSDAKKYLISILERQEAIAEGASRYPLTSSSNVPVASNVVDLTL